MGERGTGVAAAGVADPLQPVAGAERIEALDVLRGVALLGVLLVNLLSDFRVPLAEHILTFHTGPGRLDRAVDVLVAALLEFKALALFSLSFGAGVGVLAERAGSRGVGVRRFLTRRFLVLLLLGLGHMNFVWNGDILTLYAVCGLLLLPLLRLPVAALVGAGVVAIALPWAFPFGLPIPGEDGLRALAAEARRSLCPGELRRRPSLPLGGDAAAHRPPSHLHPAADPGPDAARPGRLAGRLDPRSVAAPGAAPGGRPCGCRGGGIDDGLAGRLGLLGVAVPVPAVLLDAGSSIPLALAYAAALLLWLRGPRDRPLAAPVAAAGQMALTNYLTQSLALCLIFYSYGLGMSGRLGSSSAALLGLALYAGQLAFSRVWLRRYRFGPVEWLWRSLTYGRPQPMRRVASP